MLRLIMHLFDGLPLRFSRADLERIGAEKALVILRPCQMLDAAASGGQKREMAS
jgi:hypothetical protein